MQLIQQNQKMPDVNKLRIQKLTHGQVFLSVLEKGKSTFY
jgi:hypothetical protein